MGPGNVIIALFHSQPDPANQKLVFSRLKTVIGQYKNIKTVNKKFNRVKFAIQDVMSGLNGLDRYNAKMADSGTTTMLSYLDILMSHTSLSTPEYSYNHTNAKIDLELIAKFSNEPF